MILCQQPGAGWQVQTAEWAAQQHSSPPPPPTASGSTIHVNQHRLHHLLSSPQQDGMFSQLRRVLPQIEVHHGHDFCLWWCHALPIEEMRKSELYTGLPGYDLPRSLHTQPNSIQRRWLKAVPASMKHNVYVRTATKLSRRRQWVGGFGVLSPPSSFYLQA